MTESTDPRRQLPSVDSLLSTFALSQATNRISHDYLVLIARRVLDELRATVSKGTAVPSLDEIASTVSRRVEQLESGDFRRVVNATGIILHTGLGRAPLSESARNAINRVAGYTNLELDLDSGKRGNRQEHVRDLLCILTGAESALVVNNNASAVYLVLNALAYQQEVIVSRGQLIEIGGSFRLPDIMARSGVKLVEVGTTNRTRIEDYSAAVTEKTAILLNAHPSNYRIHGFTESVSIAELAELASHYGAIVADDLGNGLLWDWSSLGFPYEANVTDSLESGADLVMVSGDKILGGPQAGIILGKKSLVDKLETNPLARVLRVDKLSLAALEATLAGFLNREHLHENNPTWTMLRESIETIQARAQMLLTALKALAGWKHLEIRESKSETGSGSLPDVQLPSYAVCCLPENISATEWGRTLRTAKTPIIGTIRDDLVWLDMRTVRDDEIILIVETISSLRR